MYRGSEMSPNPLSMSYAPYIHRRDRGNLPYSLKSLGQSNAYRRRQNDIDSSRSQYSIQIPPSSSKKQCQDTTASNLYVSPRIGCNSNRYETEPYQLHRSESQPNMEDLMAYMDYLLSQLEKSLQLNQHLTSSYDSLEKSSRELIDENRKLRAIVNDLRSQKSNANPNSNQNGKKDADISKILRVKDKIIENLTTQLGIVSKQKDNIDASLMNYDKEIIEMGKRIEALSISHPNAQEDNPQLDEAKEMMSNLMQENSWLLEDNKCKEDQIAQLKADIGNQFAKMSAIESDAKQNVLQMASLSKRSTAFQNKGKSNQVTSDNIEYKEKYDQNAQKNAQLKKSLNDLSNINTSLIDSRDKMEEAYADIIQKLQMTVNNTIKKYQNIEDIMKENETFKKQNEFLESQLKALPDLDEALKNLQMENNKMKNFIKSENEQIGNENDANEEKEEEEGIEKEDEEEEEEKEMTSKIQSNESHVPPQHSFSLYNICLNKLITYDFGLCGFKAVVPQNYASFLKEYQQEGSVLYNTLEGLFVITGMAYDQLFYYSQKKNTISPIMKLQENHCNGSMLMDDSTQSLIILSGDHTSKVEQFCFDTEKHSFLPPMLETRSNASFCFIDRKLYGFFGFNFGTLKALETIECLNLDSCGTWEYINYTPKSNRTYAISHHLVVNINDNDVLILGGIKTNSEAVNEKVISMNMKDKTIEEINSDLPLIKENKLYMFDSNSQSNILLQNNSMWLVAIDGMNNVHMLDRDLNYKVIAFSKNAGNSRQT